MDNSKIHTDEASIISSLACAMRNKKEAITGLIDAAVAHRESKRRILREMFADSRIKQLARDIIRHSVQFWQTQQQFNIFNFWTDRKNEKFHDRIIAFLLNPSEAHGLSTAPLYLFIELLNKQKALGIEKEGFENVTVHVASAWQPEPDIRISNNRHEHIIIEDKIKWAPDQPAQLERYYTDYCKKGEVKAVVYLSPHKNKQPSTQTYGSHEDEIRKKLVILNVYPHNNASSTDLTRGWMEPVLKHAITVTNDFTVVAFIKQYILLLEQLGGNYMSELWGSELMSLLLNDDGKIDKEKFDAVHAIVDNKKIDWVPYVRDRIKEDLRDRVHNKNSQLTPFVFDRRGIAFDFVMKEQPEKRFGLDIWEMDWARIWQIQIFTRDDSSASVGVKGIDSVRQSMIEFEQKGEGSDAKLFYNGDAGIEYVGNEDKFCEIVISILGTFGIDKIINTSSVRGNA